MVRLVCLRICYFSIGLPSSIKIKFFILEKVDSILAGGKASDKIRRPLIDVPLNPMQCDKMDNLAKVMNDDYSGRMKMLHTRFVIFC